MRCLSDWFRALRSAWKIVWFATRRPGVQIPQRPPFHTIIAMHNFSISEAVRKMWHVTPSTQSSVQMGVFYGTEKDGSSPPGALFRNSCGAAKNGRKYRRRKEGQFSAPMAMKCGLEKNGYQPLLMKIKNLKGKILEVRADLLIL